MNARTNALAPHPGTVDLKPLPVPELDATLDAYEHALAAVLDDRGLAHATKIVEAFRGGRGPRLDAKLRERARKREAEGTNWLHEEWYSGYLTVRDPLPLQTNVGFQIAMPNADGLRGIDRAVDFVRRAATVHLQAAAGDVPEDRDARGNRITLNQWFVYAGGLRHPAPGEDTILRTQAGAANREIGVFVNGTLYALPLTDGAGRLASADALRRGLEGVLDCAAADGAGETTSLDPADFGAPSLIGSAALAEFLPRLLAVGENARTYDRLRDMLFTVELVDAPEADGAGTSRHLSDAERIRALCFSPRGAWVYKPLSYQVSLNDDWAGVHAEHSCQDGATLVTAIGRMQDACPPEPGADGTQAGPERLAWEMGDELASELGEHLRRYADRAGALDVDIVTVPHNQPESLPFKFSRDASAQLTMLIAQVLTYGRVRGVYEAVDMREFRAGRTECLRAATPEAAAFARSLVGGTATMAELQAAVDAHRGWVKRCKSGNGFDRHIQMMEGIEHEECAGAGDGAGAGAIPDPFFTDELVTAARYDFLSTTSIGGASQIVRYCFAPTVAEGFGISYTPLEGDGEFCVSWRTDAAERADEFRRNLTVAAEALWEFCGGATPRSGGSPQATR